MSLNLVDALGADPSLTDFIRIVTIPTDAYVL